MQVLDPVYLQYYPKKSYTDNLTSRRAHILQSLNTTQADNHSPKNQFIPFVQERDHLGRLIKDVNNPPVLLRNDSFLTKLSPYSPLTLTLPKNKSTSTLPGIKSHNLQSLHKLVENSLCHTDHDSLTFASPTEMDHDRFSSNLFYIKAGKDNTLEVEHSAQLSTRKKALEPLLSPKTLTTHRVESQASVQTRDYIPTHRAHFSEKLPPLDIERLKEMNYQPSSVTIKSVDNFRPSSDLNSDYNHILSPNSSTFENHTIWRYEADQISQNKEVEKMMKKEHKKNKPRNRMQKLTIPANTDRVPPLGLYTPSLDLVKPKAKECLISPISLTKIQIEKLKQEKRNELELQRFKAENSQKKVEEENEQRKDEKYYKNLFKDMFQEGNEKQKKKKAVLDKKIQQIKKLDYRILDDFETFPTDFESKVNNLRLKLRAFKEKLSSTKDGKSN